MKDKKDKIKEALKLLDEVEIDLMWLFYNIEKKKAQQG